MTGGLQTLIWIYWFQSVIIDVFNFIRILQIKELSFKGTNLLQLSPKIQKLIKVFLACFFLFHYGIFHLVYLIFLAFDLFSKIQNAEASAVAWHSVFFMTALFLANHFFSFIYNKQRDAENENIAKLMTRPYTRIMPMHLTLIFGGFFMSSGMALMHNHFLTSEKIVLLFFLILRMIADVKMHINEHSVDERIPKIANILKET